jgi:hypothetical protein
MQRSASGRFSESIGAALAARCISSLRSPANRLQHKIFDEGLALSAGLTLV